LTIFRSSMSLNRKPLWPPGLNPCSVPSYITTLKPLRLRRTNLKMMI
jgi:hypothetical protein